MSDYLGPNQTRVLDSTNRNFESITYQKQKPPLSSEVNLTGKIDADRNQQTVQAMLPSGWLSVGQFQDGVLAGSCKVGDVLCNPDLNNAFKLIAQDYGLNTEKNIAWVNGWRIVVQGIEGPHNDDQNYTPHTNSTEDNLITLPPPPANGDRIDFVFLEVWRKLLTPDDPIYPYGNVDYFGSPFTNDLIDPARGFETSLRVQLQYRIRVSTLDDFYLSPDGFNESVYVQGPLTAPISSSSNYNFTKAPNDPGLWIGGAGDEVDQEALQTVDGHTYAIPMFVIRRRSQDYYDPKTHSNGAGKTLADYLAGVASDRPDNFYQDWIVSEDFVDLRHRISSTFLSSVCASTFRALQANTLKTKMGSKFFGDDRNHGSSLINVDTVSSFSQATGWSNWLGVSGNGVRKAFSNATVKETFYVLKTVADKTVGTPGAAWAPSDEVAVDLAALGYPSNATPDSISPANYNWGVGGVEVSIPSASPTGQVLNITLGYSPGLGSLPIVFPITVTYAASSQGLTQVPTEFLEARKIEIVDPMYPIAMKDQDIRVRYGTAALPVDTSDLGPQYNMLRARGGDTKHHYDFGHQMIYHTPGTGTNILSFTTPIDGYDIIGVAKIVANGSEVSNPSVAIIDSTYTINLGSNLTSGYDAALTLYTGNKYFEGNKQGRSIYDCYQMVKLDTVETPNSSLDTFTLKTYDSSIATQVLGIASYSSTAGIGYAYIKNTFGDMTKVDLLTTNASFPDTSATTNIITFSSPPATGTTLEVPVLIRSAIGPSEGYAFFYKYNAYQGILKADSTVYATGAIEHEGPAITTTAGSGAIVDATYSNGQASFTVGSTSVMGSGTEWLSILDSVNGNLKAKYVIGASADATTFYPIYTAVSDTEVILTTPAVRTSASPESYVIIAKDQPASMYSNIIDRCPTYLNVNDSSGANNLIKFVNSDGDTVLETRVISKVQDIIDFPEGARIGTQQTPDSIRGKKTVHLPDARLGRSNLGLKFESLDMAGSYKKTYQSYILNENNSGRLLMMVVGSETDSTSANCHLNEKSDNDTVDLFEIPGRPLIANRNQ